MSLIPEPFIARLGAKQFVLVVCLLIVTACGKKTSSSSADAIDVSFVMDRAYTGKGTNGLTITAPEGSDDNYSFSVSSELAQASVTEDVPHPLVSQTVTFAYTGEGVYSADFKIEKANGYPFVFEILTWEYSTEVPDAPVISFAKTATKTLINPLLVSDSRTATTSDLWVAGDLTIPATAELEDDGYWIATPAETLSVPVTLTPGDGIKTINGKFRNVFGNAGADAAPAEIILKQTPSEGCDAVPISTTIANNKLSLLLSITDPYQTYYSVMGDVKAVVNQNPFADGDVVFVYVEPTPGMKHVVVYLEDIAGNVCLAKEIDVLLDPSYESEGIFVDGATYWTDSENIVVDVFFNHFPDQEPLQIKITGDVEGSNTFHWIDYEPDLPITITPSTTGSRRIYAQYKDKDGTESYLITKRIYLKPGVTLVPGVAPFIDVVASNIVDAESLTIVGCEETYTEVAYSAAYTCEPKAGVTEIDVTWNFGDDITLTKDAPVPP